MSPRHISDRDRDEVHAADLWLGRLLASLLPDEPEALGLLALMLFAEARRDARRNAAGDYVPLADHDPKIVERAPDRFPKASESDERIGKNRATPAASRSSSSSSPGHRAAWRIGRSF